MFGGTGKKVFVRTQIPRSERLLSWSLLGVIIAVGVAIYLQGQRYDPGLFALDTSSLSPAPTTHTPAERQGEQREEGLGEKGATNDRADRTPAERQGEPYEGLGEKGATNDRANQVAAEPPVSSTGPLLDGLAPPGWQAMGPVEQFHADNLYEKIDGRADQYLAYDVVGLTCLSLTEPGGQFIDLYLYDMGQPLHAFGIFSVERAPEHETVRIGREGYRVAASYFFWKGSHYVQVLASEPTAPLQQAAEYLARGLEDRLSDSGEAIWGLTALPAANRVPDSVQYFKRDALSLDFLANACTALYQQNGVEVTAFLSRQDSPGAADQTLAAYLTYLESYGRIIDRLQVGDNTLIIGDLGGYFDAVFRRGNLVGGVAMAGDRTAAEEVATALLRHLGDR